MASLLSSLLTVPLGQPPSLFIGAEAVLSFH
jgi:hypothetical protein